MTYLSELRTGDRISVRVRLVGRSARAAHVVVYLLDDTHQRVSYVMEEIFLHIDMASRRTRRVARGRRRRARPSHRRRRRARLAADAVGLDVPALIVATVEPTDLLGTWTLTRVVDDHRDGERREVVGTAELAEVSRRTGSGGAEEGTMSWPGHAVPVEPHAVRRTRGRTAGSCASRTGDRSTPGRSVARSTTRARPTTTAA